MLPLCPVMNQPLEHFQYGSTIYLCVIKLDLIKKIKIYKLYL